MAIISFVLLAVDAAVAAVTAPALALALTVNVTVTVENATPSIVLFG